MSALIINGKELSANIELELSEQAAEIHSRIGRMPSLRVVLVGNNPASEVYVASKTKRARACGLAVEDLRLPEDVTQPDLEISLKALSIDKHVDGILLQLPLPKHLDELSAILSIAPAKDVDGLNPYNQGLLFRGQARLVPCTPLGIIELIKDARRELYRDDNLSGLSATVIGRSSLVGKPVAMLLTQENCTVTLCHSKTENLKAACVHSDIVVAAVGMPKLIKKDFIKTNAVVIDVGINRSADGKLIGDVDFDEVKEKAAAITPVPGGVGPMTIAMLIKNTLIAAGNQ
ncbi:MAG: bifunctional 5,10-methylenetetrahydrofolate dehydrogenase/5,10-methenyltetrahydrofolate cyclohydrolase [Deltaproteobacteria bacterium]|nr:bifunctional 5,10-methylenetetrahydrofolate dehydrogenase/5,10-methenyltetrahydrofolate cyclohydrolase [Deltaproteobacteria bacterium]